MSNVTVVAKFVAGKEFAEAVKTELLKLIIPTRKESGCIEYNLHQDNDNPAVFIFYETWESTAHLTKHMNSANFKTFISSVEGMIDEIAVHKMTRIE